MTDPELPIDGGCYCGDIRYRLSETPGATAICHCQTCRSVSGAESVGWVVCPISGFEIVRGEPTTFNSSKGVERMFCGRCGTGLTYRTYRDSIDVTLASLDDPEAVPPKKEVWCQDRLSWNSLNRSLDHFDKGGN